MICKEKGYEIDIGIAQENMEDLVSEHTGPPLESVLSPGTHGCSVHTIF